MSRFAAKDIEQLIRPDGEENQFLNTIADYEVDFTQWLNRRGLTLNAITAEVSENLELVIDAVNNNAWTGRVKAVVEGEGSLIVTMQADPVPDGPSEKVVIRVNVSDARSV